MWQKVCLILTRSLRAREKGSRQKQHLGSRGSHVVTSNSSMPRPSDTEAKTSAVKSHQKHMLHCCPLTRTPSGAPQLRGLGKALPQQDLRE